VPRGRFQLWHQRSTISSDRKRSIVFQLKTISSHHRRAGSAKWTIPSPVSSPPHTDNSIASPEIPHEVSTRPSLCNVAMMPRLSQIQLPNHRRPLTSVTNGVGTAENGLAIKISPVGCSTSK